MQNFRSISEEIKNLVSIFEIAVAPHRNAMRTRYKDRPEKSTNGVGMITPLHDLCSHAVGRARIRFMTKVKLKVRVGSGLVAGS